MADVDAGGGWARRLLIGSVAVLLPAGVWSALVLAPGPAPRVIDARAGATGFGEVAALEDPGPAAAEAVTVTVAPSPTTPPVALPTTATTAKPQATTTTTTTTPRRDPTTTVPVLPPGNIAAASTWAAEVPGLKIRLRMEPAAPMVGQTVRFRLDVTSVDRCCHAFFSFGDGNTWILHNQVICSFEHELTPGAHRAEFTHTYAEPGAYLAEVRIHDGSMCEPFPETGPPFRHVEMPACVAIGPGTAAATGCKPASNPFPFLPPPPA